MARSIYFMAFLFLAMTLFVAYGVQGKEICCKVPTTTFLCTNDPQCKTLCSKVNYEDGHCFDILNKCVCMNRCVQDAKTLAAELLEEEFLKQ
ncbi:flower-specific defensin-like [Capsicum galapagoense]